MGESTRTLMKKYALDYCLSDLEREIIWKNEIYTHRSGQLCCWNA